MKSQKLTGAENIHWDLTTHYSGLNDPAIQTVMDTCVKDAGAFKSRYQGKLNSLTSAGMEKAYRELIDILERIYKLSQFAGLSFVTDTTNEQAKALESKVDEINSTVSNLTLFFTLELGAMPDDEFSKFEDQPELKEFRYPLDRTRETAKYNLSEKEEQLNNLKNLTGKSALVKIYNELTTSFKFEFEVDGETRERTGDELRSLRQHPDKNIRRQAMKLLLDRYEDNKIVISSVYNNILKDFNIGRELRGYPTPISVMNIGNDLDEEAVQTLIDVTTDSNRLVQRYYRLKARVLELDDMTLADIYAPLPAASRSYTWEEASEQVLTAFGEFDDEFHQLAKSMFDNNRIDAPAQPGKQGGAFCSYSVPSVQPFVFLNFTGKLRDVATLAHELGHAIHGMLAKDQNLFTFHSILPLAETASVFSEMVLTDMLLKQDPDVSVKRSLLTTKLEDIFSTSNRQNMFCRFEKVIHDRISRQLMSANELCDAYETELQRMFGDSVIQPTEFRWEWSTIPHLIHVPFYVYAYNFANLVVLALYQQYLEEGAAFIPKFKTCLAAGSSMRPTDIIGVTGQDITDPEFWNKSIQYVEGLIDQLEELV